MNSFAIAVFALCYLGMALGRVPGLKLDRSGIALLALAALLAAGALDLSTWAGAVEVPTVTLLFALMLLSAQFQAAGFYDFCAARIATAWLSPRGLLAMTVAVAGGLSAILANDVVVFALTPLLAAGMSRRRRDPRPYLLALAAAANAGSAATVIGNPQNILIGQVGQLDFLDFLAICGPPAVIALLLTYFSIGWRWRRELATTLADEPTKKAQPVLLDRWQTAKGALAAAAIVILFLTDLPHEIGALVIAALLLASRRLASRDMLGTVDWHLLLLFACLFGVTAAFGATGLPERALEWLGARGLAPESLAMLLPVSLAASNTVGNVPAVILILGIWPAPPEGALYALALLTTLSGNLLLTGSIANLIVAERAQAVGVRLSFADFARAGVPMTLASLAVAALWLWAVGAVGV